MGATITQKPDWCDALAWGIIGMVRPGVTAQQAWAEIKEALEDAPSARRMFEMLSPLPECVELLDSSQKAWSRHGLPSPFEGLLKG